MPSLVNWPSDSGEEVEMCKFTNGQTNRQTEMDGPQGLAPARKKN